MQYNNNCVPDHPGEHYQETLARLHRELQPKSYLEIGTLHGDTLRLSSAASIAVDTNFQLSSDIIGNKPQCHLYQMGSDAFFEQFVPKTVLGIPLDFAFLDGMHHCEFLLRDFMNTERHAAPGGVIALHDCLPTEIPMTDRTQDGTPPIAPHRAGAWTGDVWRTVAVIKKLRPDLRIICLNSAPTGLVLISKLDQYSDIIQNKYQDAVELMMRMDLEEITVAGFLRDMSVVSTHDYIESGALHAALQG